MTTVSDDVRAVLAGLRSASAEERVAAARRAAELTDLNQLEEHERQRAVPFRAAGAEMAAAGVCAALVEMLGHESAEQQTACAALRSIFDVFGSILASAPESRAIGSREWDNAVQKLVGPGAFQPYFCPAARIE